MQAGERHCKQAELRQRLPGRVVLADARAGDVVRRVTRRRAFFAAEQLQLLGAADGLLKVLDAHLLVRVPRLASAPDARARRVVQDPAEPREQGNGNKRAGKLDVQKQ